jgi:hypothetical protein
MITYIEYEQGMFKTADGKVSGIREGHRFYKQMMQEIADGKAIITPYVAPEE